MRADHLQSTSIYAGAIAAATIVLSCQLAAEPPLPERATVPTFVSTPDSLAPGSGQAAQAFAVLERHCARCHDTRRLKRRLPAAGIANILDLDAIAARRDLVRPGYPEGSPLYTSVLTRHMPYDVFQDLKRGDEPTPEEIAELHAWISGLPKGKSCQAAETPVLDVSALIEQDMQSLAPDVATRRRYLSLSDVASACDGKQVREAYRHAAAKLINLLSRAEEPFRPELIGKDGFILAIDLDDIGWSAAQWDELAEQAPAPFAVHNDGSRNPAAAPMRVLPTAWLAHLAMDPGVYAHLVGIPTTLPEFFSAFRIGDQQPGSAPTYRLDESPVTGGGRNLSRLIASSQLPVWTAQDFAGGSKKRSTKSSDNLLETRVILQLPNGFPLFGLYNREGTLRLNVHKSAVTSEVKQAGAAGAGLQCLACHGSGLKGFEATSVTENAPPGGWQATRDNQAFYLALRAIGIPPALEIDGLEPVIALAERYQRELGLYQVAAELDLAPTELTKALHAAEGKTKPIARRLLQDLITRGEFNELRRHLEAPRQHKAPPFESDNRLMLADNEIRLSLWTEKAGYNKGEQVTLHAATTAPCRLTLISVDQSGDAVVVFPSEYQDDNLLQPSVTRAIPTPASGFRLRVDQPGREAVIGVCMGRDRKNPPGIIHDHELQPFTLLGDWAKHIKHALEADAAERRNAGRPAKRKRRRRRARLVKRPPTRANKLPLPQDWTMIMIRARPNKDAAFTAPTPNETAPPASSNSE